MKITNNFDPRMVAEAYLKRVQKIEKDEQGNVRKADQKFTRTDEIEISARARELQLYRVRLKEIPEVRAELVSAIKKQLERGTYQLDAEKIAGGIVAEHRLDKRV
ncbi:MAG: flagellar biosynthesis anti-sigma factor FlgM [Armatimonadetes bacterium]|nr:flagellar biosynthesis anti-sigma factor FlgM [Armatimonadota bacterium]